MILFSFFFFLQLQIKPVSEPKGGVGVGGWVVWNPGALPWLRHWRTSTLFHSRRSDCSFLNSLKPSQQDFLKNFQLNLHFTYYAQGKYVIVKGNLCFYKCVIDVLYIFDRAFKKNIIFNIILFAPDLRQIILVLIFAICSARFYLWRSTIQ